VTADLSDVRRTPTFRAGSYKPNARIKEAGGALDDLLLAHLDLDYRIRRPGGPAGNERALTLEEARDPSAVTCLL